MALCQRTSSSRPCCGLLSPPDIQYRFERALGNRVLMVSGSDEHGTPITVTAEQNGITPQAVVDEYHQTNLAALLKLGCGWAKNVDTRGPEYGGALFNRTSDSAHKQKVQDNFTALEKAGFFIRKTMEQYYEINPDGPGRFLPDRYVEGPAPHVMKKELVEINVMPAVPRTNRLNSRIRFRK